MQDLEFAQIQMKVVEGLKQGNEALEKMHEVQQQFMYLLIIRKLESKG